VKKNEKTENSMPLIFQKVIKRSDLQDNPNVLYVFGDNLGSTGYGGQAAEMRGEPNAIGIPTKLMPSMSENAFFTDKNYDEAQPVISQRCKILMDHSDKGGIIVWPHDDIGTGRAQLQNRAPKIWALIQEYKNDLRRT
jgi:hypothetical protein